MHPTLPRLLQSMCRPVVCAQNDDIEGPAQIPSSQALPRSLLLLKASVCVVDDDPSVVTLGLVWMAVFRELDFGPSIQGPHSGLVNQMELLLPHVWNFNLRSVSF